MKAEILYKRLEKDFIKKGLSDDWAQHMSSIHDFISKNFKKRSMGLVCDFTKDVTKVYTAVFPSKSVMKRILDDNASNAMLFVHHPSIWDIRKAPQIFDLMDRKLLKQFRDKKISIYNLHVPLDNYGPYSTSTTLAKALRVTITKPFGQYFGSLCGVIGTTDIKTVKELKNKFQSAVGHDVILYKYGDDKIRGSKVALIAGGGNEIVFLEEIAKEGVNTFVTGITIKNDYSKKVHDFAKSKKINILGGTHYSTEKFACIAMCEYFKKLGLPCEFIDDMPIMEDM